MTDSASLACTSAAFYVSDDVICGGGAGQFERLFNDQFEGCEIEVILQITTIDCDVTLSRYQTDSGNGCFFCGQCRSM